MSEARQINFDRAEKETNEMACKWLFNHLPFLVNYFNLFLTQMEIEQ